MRALGTAVVSRPHSSFDASFYSIPARVLSPAHHSRRFCLTFVEVSFE